MRSFRFVVIVAFLSLPAWAEWHGALAAESHGTLFNAGSGAPLVGLNFGWALRGGVFDERWGFFVHAEQGLWQGTEYGAKIVPGTFNGALGVELRFANGLIRSSLGLGPSVLLFDTLLDRRGSVGLFVDARPLGLRWRLDRHFGVGFDPLSFVAVAPVLGGIPLVRLQFRTTLVLEVWL